MNKRVKTFDVCGRIAWHKGFLWRNIGFGFVIHSIGVGLVTLPVIHWQCSSPTAESVTLGPKVFPKNEIFRLMVTSCLTDWLTCSRSCRTSCYRAPWWSRSPATCDRQSSWNRACGRRCPDLSPPLQSTRSSRISDKCRALLSLVFLIWKSKNFEKWQFAVTILYVVISNKIMTRKKPNSTLVLTQFNIACD